MFLQQWSIDPSCHLEIATPDTCLVDFALLTSCYVGLGLFVVDKP